MRAALLARLRGPRGVTRAQRVQRRCHTDEKVVDSSTAGSRRPREAGRRSCLILNLLLVVVELGRVDQQVVAPGQVRLDIESWQQESCS